MTGARFPSPERGADTLAVHPPGDEVEAAGVVVRDGVPWIETRGGGWIEACRLDRLPARIEGDLPPGSEGLAAGRILPFDYEPSDLVELPVSLAADGYEWRRLRLRRPAAKAFEMLVAAAAEEGITIGIFSAYRDAAYQAGLYERAIERNPGQRRTAAPGRSEHQLGTAVDVTAPGVPVLSEKLARSEAGRWLARRCEEFGVVMTFSSTRHESRGTAFEPWHLRWVGEGALAREKSW